jgi:hypothetical protein
MSVLSRLKVFIHNLTEEEKKILHKTFKRGKDKDWRSKSPNYVVLYFDIMEYSFELSNNSKEVKTFDDTADNLLRKIAEILAKEPTSRRGKNILKLNEILFLYEHELDELATKKGLKLLASLDPNTEGWIGSFLYNKFYDHATTIENKEIYHKLNFICAKFAGFGNGKSETSPYIPIEFVQFIQEFQSRSSDLNHEYQDIIDEKNRIPINGFTTLYRRMKLTLQASKLMLEKFPFIQQRGDIHDLLKREEQSFINDASHNFHPAAPYSISAHFVLTALQEQQLMVKLYDVSIEENMNRYAFEKELINDITLRMAVNEMVMRLFSYSPIDDRSREEMDELLDDLVKLKGKAKEQEEFALFIQSIYCLVFNNNENSKKHSTYHNWKSLIIESNNPFYIECVGKKVGDGINKPQNQLQEIVAKYKEKVAPSTKDS